MPYDVTDHTVSIAVLPFENLSGEAQYAYFASGFVEDLITDLSHFHSLHVISSYTSRKIGAAAGNPVSSAGKLSIDYLLKGSLRRQSGRIRINPQLLDTNDGRILWAERYEAPLDDIFEIQDDIVERVAGAISAQIDTALLTAARKKPITNLAAYDCWLRGMEQIRMGTPEADQKARDIFRQAIAIDPDYGRAYAGLSLAYFNDWSCQLWEQWEETERNAYKYARKAIELDDSDHITQYILGRILLYRRQFDLAEQHVNQSLGLNANDADNLVQIATCKAFLDKAAEGEKLYLKALRLNPYRNIWYFTAGSFTYFAQRKYQACIDTALKGPLTDVWIDLPAFIAAAHAHLGNVPEAGRYLSIFQNVFHEKIITDHEARPEEIIRWVKMANPFKNEGDMAHFIDGLAAAGLKHRAGNTATTGHQLKKPSLGEPSDAFENVNGMWRFTYQDETVELPEVKGFHDLARLMTTPGRQIHCTEMMEMVGSMSEEDLLMDHKARRSYERRIHELKQDIEDADAMNDLIRKEKLGTELDQLIAHISKSVGMGGRPRRLQSATERARAAVTWRIRSAIKKINTVHPALGRHLDNSVRTGMFCSYSPEKNRMWRLSP